MKFTIEIDQETLDKSLVKNLIEDYKSLMLSIEELESKDRLEQYQMIDLQDHIKYSSAIAVILQYYMTTEEYYEFFTAK